MIVGGGQAGLAVSRCLSDLSVDHVVIERGRVAERWRSERWDSLRLLTPNWQTRLPGFRYQGSDPHGYMTMPELVRFFEQYAMSFAAPIEPETAVTGVEPSGGGFRVDTTRGAWQARTVVVATGYSDLPFVPPAASSLAPRLEQVVPTRYRHPGQLPPGGVLVVGASATGIQLAEEIHASGRPVTLAVGGHLRLPRVYRGRDILWWLDAMGVFDDTLDCLPDARASLAQPSLQLIGHPDRRSLDVAALHRQGVRLAGRLIAADGEAVTFDDDLIATTVASDVKLADVLKRIDGFIARSEWASEAPDAGPFEPTWPVALNLGRQTVDLRSAGISTVLWATGFRRAYPWLEVPVFDESGNIRHRFGVTPVPGLYVLGMHFQRRRKSAFIDGVGEDAAFVARRIAATGRRSATVRTGGAFPWPAPQVI